MSEIRMLWKMARDVLEDPEIDSYQIRAAVLILAAHFCGHNRKRLHAFTGIPMSDVDRVSYYLRQGGIWCADGFRAPWLDNDGKYWPYDFVMHVLVATGNLQCEDGERFRIRSCDGVPWRDIVPARPVVTKLNDGLDVPWWVPKAERGAVSV